MKNEKRESILSGILKYSISMWINLIVGFLSVLITTRILSPDTYGNVSIFLSASGFLMYVVTLGMDGAYIRFYNEPPGKDTRNQLLFKLILYSTVICLIIGIIATFLLYKPVSQYIFGIVSQIIVGIVFLYTFCQTILRLLNITFRMGFKTTQYNIQNVLINCLARILIIVVAIFTSDYRYIVSIMSIGTFVVMLFYLFIQRKEIIPINSFDKVDFSLSLRGYKEFFKFSLFSAPTYFVSYFNTFASQQIIRSSLDAYELGIFSSCGMFNTMFAAVQGGFTTYWSAYIYKNHSDEHEKISKMHDFVLLFTIAAMSGLVCFRDAIYLIIGEEYHDGKKIFSVLLIATAMNFVRETTDKGVAIAKKNEITLISHIVSMIVNIVSCIILTKFIGLLGAAYANALASIVLYLIMTIFGQQYFCSINNLKRSLIGVGLILMILLLPSVVYDIKLIVLAVIILDIAATIIFKDQIKETVLILSSFINKHKKS